MENNELILLDNIAYFNQLYDEYSKNNEFTIGDVVEGYKAGLYSTPIDMVASDDFDKVISYIEKNPSLMNLQIINLILIQSINNLMICILSYQVSNIQRISYLIFSHNLFIYKLFTIPNEVTCFLNTSKLG